MKNKKSRASSLPSAKRSLEICRDELLKFADYQESKASEFYESMQAHCNRAEAYEEAAKLLTDAIAKL